MHKRVAMISQLGWIPKDIKSVADYGCGHMALKEQIPEITTYYPIDYKQRADRETIICDFNKWQFSNIYSEMSVCRGVLMYIDPAEKLIVHICEHTKYKIIFSFVTLEGFPDIDARRRSGMWQDFTEKEIIELVAEHEYQLEDIKYDTDGNTTMTFFLFKKGNKQVI